MTPPTLSRRRLCSLGIGAVAAAGLPASLHGLPASLVGSEAPAFTRQGLDGRTLSLHDLRGRVILLNFWATWCAPCLKEMPVFAQWLVECNGRGLEVLGVNMDDDPEPVRTVVSRLHLNYPVLRGDAELARRYGGVLGLPVTFLIDRRGIVRRRIDGAANLAAMHAEVLALLA